MIWIDGHPDARLPATDRGLAYGDGVFRTLRCAAGEILWWQDQYAKLRADAMRLALPCPPEEAVRGQLETAIAADPGANFAKLVLTRGDGTRGYGPPPDPRGRLIIMTGTTESVLLAQPLTARWCQLRLAVQPRLAGIKHLNRLENVLARAEWSDPAIAEGLLMDTAGHVIGGTMSNLLLWRGGELLVPDLRGAGVAGVTRLRILRGAARAGLRVNVRAVEADEVMVAEAAFLCNSLAGVRQIAVLEGRSWPPHEIGAALLGCMHESP